MYKLPLFCWTPGRAAAALSKQICTVCSKSFEFDRICSNLPVWSVECLTALTKLFPTAISVMGVDASSWTADVPKSVSGLRGSCIVIPCSFNYPEPEKKPSKFTGIWLKGTHDTIFHPDISNIIKDYRGRTELVGDLRQKNCSLRIDPLHDSDKGSFTFRIEMEDHNNYSFYFLSVSEEVKLREVVSASCSVSHSCPSDSPLLTWNHSGTRSVQSQQLTNGQWEVTSSLTFNPTISDNNQPLVCTAAFRGGKTVNRSKTLNVKCKMEQSCELTTMFGRFILPFLKGWGLKNYHGIFLLTSFGLEVRQSLNSTINKAGHTGHSFVAPGLLFNRVVRCHKEGLRKIAIGSEQFSTAGPWMYTEC
uniref:Ig-like domain-containing protein n=1 Tax=Oncorhynchus kisutch TaxID=8019 RepID=A0A8C7CEF7_ONCKI